MKKKIGFIDYYIDEWHANNYPEFIRAAKLGESYEVAMAWEKCCPEGKVPLAQWCKQHGVAQAGSIAEVVDSCDCLIVLSPDNPEMHEELADLALRSGKPVYVDKPFAASLQSAARMFSLADAHGTPLMSSSALRFASAMQSFVKDHSGEQVDFASTRGGSYFGSYAIHQIEMLVMAMGTGSKRVMQAGNKTCDVMLIDYGAGRRGMIQLMYGYPFDVSICVGQNETVRLNEIDDFFPRFIDGMLEFFETGRSAVSREQTLEVIALVEAGLASLQAPDEWIAVPTLAG